VTAVFQRDRADLGPARAALQGWADIERFGLAAPTQHEPELLAPARQHPYVAR
jgi:hypothetical protein